MKEWLTAGMLRPARWILVVTLAFLSAFEVRASHGAEASMQDLEAIVGDAELVNFGESSHFVKGLHAFAAQAFQHLAQEKGFRLFVFESAWGVDEAMREFFASDREAPTQDEAFFLNAFFSEETIGLLRWIRDFNRKHPDDPISVTGYQPEQPVTDFRALWAFASKSKKFGSAGPKADVAAACKIAEDHQTNLQYFKSLFEYRKAGKPTFTAEERAACLRGIDELERFVQRHKKELVRASSLAAWREALLHAKSFRTYMTVISPAADQLALNPDMSEDEAAEMSRQSYTEIDKTRFEIFQTLRETRYPDKKVMFWMHNWHAARRSQDVELTGRGAIPKGTISMGTRLSEVYGDRLVTIGSIVGCPSCQTPEREDALAPKFVAAFGKGSALIDLRKLPEHEFGKFGIGAPGAIVQQFNPSLMIVDDLRRQFDAIYYLSESKRVGEK